MAPAIVMKAESTAAKTGRSMKKWDSFTQVSPCVRLLRVEREHALAGFARAHGDALRGDLDTGTHALQAVHDDVLAGLHAITDDAQTIDERPELHGAVLHLVVRADGEDVAHVLIRADRAVVDEDGVVLA